MKIKPTNLKLTQSQKMRELQHLHFKGGEMIIERTVRVTEKNQKKQEESPAVASLCVNGFLC